jgi:hypothetical protein
MALNSFTEQDLANLPGTWGIGHVSLKKRRIRPVG